jgi:NAD-dependent SIR2 family protein deacetylase
MTTNIIKKYFEEADGILLLTGAGMGVDGGIPDFRGKTGIWTEEKGIFLKYSTGDAFHLYPLEAWNFYISRFLKYKGMDPHRGYYDLLNLIDIGHDIFSVTSNVDGHFKRSGYDTEKLYEIHGNLEWVQCSKFCCRDILPMPNFDQNITSLDSIPHCHKCGSIMRPMVMLFNDSYFYPKFTTLQSINYINWSSNKKNVLGIEIGAGLAVPSIRNFSHEHTARLIRINPHDHTINRKQDVSIKVTALTGIDTIFKLLQE